MTPDELFEEAWYLIHQLRPSTHDIYLLFANKGHLGVCTLRDFPQTAWTIKAFDYVNIQNGFSRAEVHRIRVMINFLVGMELLV